MTATTQAKIDAWLRGAAGRAMNPDHAYGLQCVDVIDDYGQNIFGKSWTQVVGGVSGAKDLLNRMPAEFWTRIVNDPKQPNQLPQKGDVIVYPGRAGNLWLGHTAVVLSADKNGVWVIEQNGWTNKPAQKAYHSFKSYLPSGWLRPHVTAPKPAPRPKAVYVTVQRGWGLSNVAQAAGYKDFGSDKRWAAIAKLNKSGDWRTFNRNLKPGQTVRVK